MHTLRVVLAFLAGIGATYIVARALVAYMVSENQREARRRIDHDLRARDRRSQFRVIGSDRITPTTTTNASMGPGTRQSGPTRSAPAVSGGGVHAFDVGAERQRSD